jgi:hypothetical protein
VATCASCDADEDLIYWYHGVQVSGDREHKLLTSEFGDDYDSLPMYEQIYALAGPTQTYRLTGDPRILYDIEKTIELFDKFYKDNDQGGYFSHIDPISLDPRSPLLDKGNNRARKNWNSVGDHAPGLPDQPLAGDRRGQAPRLPGRHRRHHRQALPRLRAFAVCPGALPRRLEPRQHLELAAGPRGGWPQSQDRLEPDANPQHSSEVQVTSNWPRRSPS